jgi:hypothetical protein
MTPGTYLFYNGGLVKVIRNDGEYVILSWVVCGVPCYYRDDFSLHRDDPLLRPIPLPSHLTYEQVQIGCDVATADKPRVKIWDLKTDSLALAAQALVGDCRRL